jgi:transposase InsO family protein
VWPADFKGHFKTKDGRYCYPLTVTDHFSRSLLLCDGLRSTKTEDTQNAFQRLFREVGLPEAIRTDNGAPFASPGIQGLSRLNVWWMKLGIVHQRISPASPQENGSHERMHRELKRETVVPAAANLRSQQERFDRFRARYNDQRPHEAIANEVPAARWRPSPRPYPERLAQPEYPSHMEVRTVYENGAFPLRQRLCFLTTALRGELIGLESVGEGLWNIVFYNTLIGRIDEQTRIVSSATPYAYEV